MSQVTRNCLRNHKIKLEIASKVNENKWNDATTAIHISRFIRVIQRFFMRCKMPVPWVVCFLHANHTEQLYILLMIAETSNLHKY